MNKVKYNQQFLTVQTTNIKLSFLGWNNVEKKFVMVKGDLISNCV